MNAENTEQADTADIKGALDAEEMPSFDPIGQTARDVFGVEYLYPYQRLVIADILDTANDANTEKCAGRVVLLPTGAGKSLCFMVPAMLLPSPTLVIYPLLSLMADQERRLKEAGVDCAVLRGGQTEEEREAQYKNIKDGAHIIITNPEMLGQDAILARLSECGVSHIAIDEAHCVAEWGDSFRPSYLSLRRAIKTLHASVVTAFTATASAEVLHRIAIILFEDEWSNIAVIRSDADRQNLHYFVVNACDKVQAALSLICTEAKPALIFCGTRYRAQNMAREICALHGYGAARFYHAGMTRQERKETEEWFFGSEDGVLCATCAYGMGVDKRNIRTVIHLDAPETAEQYLQEAGRGGRDGKEMNAILLWSPADTAHFEAFNVYRRERVMLRYGTTKDCRRQVLLDAMGAEKALCSGCDNCGQTLVSPPAWDGGVVLRLIAHNRLRYTAKETVLKITERMNRITEKTLKVRTWSGEAARTVMDTLFAAGMVKEAVGLWKGKITVAGKWKELLDAQKRPSKKDALPSCNAEALYAVVESGDNRS